MVLRETLNDCASVYEEDLLDVIEMDRMVLRETLNDYASVYEEDLLDVIEMDRMVLRDPFTKKTSLMLLRWTEWSCVML